MTPHEYCKRFGACKEGTEFALTFPSMYEVWHSCSRPDWLYFMIRHNKLPPNQHNECTSAAQEIINTFLESTKKDREQFCFHFLEPIRYRQLYLREKIQLCNLLRDAIPCPFEPPTA